MNYRQHHESPVQLGLFELHAKLCRSMVQNKLDAELHLPLTFKGMASLLFHLLNLKATNLILYFTMLLEFTVFMTAYSTFLKTCMELLIIFFKQL